MSDGQSERATERGASIGQIGLIACTAFGLLFFAVWLGLTMWNLYATDHEIALNVGALWLYGAVFISLGFGLRAFERTVIHR